MISTVSKIILHFIKALIILPKLGTIVKVSMLTTQVGK